jgi:CheY-like chemotaxis protein
VILFVDDEIDRLENDVEELKLCGYEVQTTARVDEAMKFLEAQHDEIDGVICDIMMPHWQAFPVEGTREGLRTGLKLFEWARGKWPGLPFVIFTNVSSDVALWEQFQRAPACIYIEKQDTYGLQFVDRVKALIPLVKGAKGSDQLGSGD